MLKFFMLFATLMIVAPSPSFAGNCCSTGCPEIVPCPLSEPVVLTCAPGSKVYEVYGYFEYWTELMHTRRACYRNDYLFEAMIFDEDSILDPLSQDYKNLKKIILHPWWPISITTTKEIAHRLDWHRRGFRAVGCFTTDAQDYFIAETVDMSTTPAVGTPVKN